MKTKYLLVVGLGVLTPLVARSADEPRNTQKSSSDYPVYRLAPGDKVSISVIGHEKLRLSGITIDPQGFVRAAEFTEPVKLAGLSVAEAQALLETRYRKRGVSDPHCSLVIDAYAPRRTTK